MITYIRLLFIGKFGTCEQADSSLGFSSPAVVRQGTFRHTSEAKSFPLQRRYVALTSYLPFGTITVRVSLLRIPH